MTSRRTIRSPRRTLPDNTNHAQQTDSHTPGKIRSHNPSKRTAADMTP